MDPERYNLSKDTQIGWIAQDVQDLIPEIVMNFHNSNDNDTSNSEEDLKAIAYSHACPLLAEGIKELHTKLNTEIGELKREYEAAMNSVRLENKGLKEELVELKALFRKYMERSKKADE